MKRDYAFLRVLLAIALIALPLILVAATLEPLERSPVRTGRNAGAQQQQSAPDAAPDAPTPAATP